MIELALKYPPSTRAFLGAALDELGYVSFAESLKTSLNPITSYNLPVAKTFKSLGRWNIR
jgi:hypothetical protein